MVREYGWQPNQSSPAHLVSKADYAPDDPDREYFEQALIDGEVLVFHTYPAQDSQ